MSNYNRIVVTNICSVFRTIYFYNRSPRFVAVDCSNAQSALNQQVCS